MKQGAIYSASLHLFVLTLLMLGLPHFARETTTLLQPIPIEIVTNVTEKTAAPAPKPIVEEKLEKLIEIKPKSEPVPNVLPQAQPMPAKNEVMPTPKPVTIPEKTDSKVTVKEKPQEKKKEPVPTPKPKDKPTPPKPEKKVTKPTRSFDSVLKNLQKSAPMAAVTPNDNVQDEIQAHTGDISDQLSISELDVLRRQIARCWSIPGGARNAESLTVQVWVSMSPDGTVRDARIVNAARMGSDSYYRVAAESALRAIRHPNCSPLQLPANKFNIWKEFTFTFNPKDML